MKKHKQQEPRQLPGWTPFMQTPPVPMPDDREIARIAKLAKVSFEEMRGVQEDIRRDTIVVNSRYQVNIRRHLPPPGSKWPVAIQLSIKRHDRQRVGPERYRDFLRIKNELVGPMHEGWEIYPGMDRNVDTANQYYMWVFEDPTMRFPLGFMEGRMTDHKEAGENHVNQPFDEGDLQWQHLNRERPAYQMD